MNNRLAARRLLTGAGTLPNRSEVAAHHDRRP
jgi:hypothetical protein